MRALSYAHGASAVPLRFETVGENLRRTAERYGASDALVSRAQRRRLTWSELREEVRLCARGLIARGVQKGDRVAIFAANRVEWVVVQYAAASVGALLVNVNPACKAAELTHVIRHSGTSLLVYAREFRASDQAREVARARLDCPELREVVQIEQDWGALVAAGSRVPEAELSAREATLDPGEAVNIQYTSHGSSAPRGATLSHHAVVNNAFFTGERLRLTNGDRVCVAVPFFHSFGMVLGTVACAVRGACIVLPGESFDPSVVLKTIAEERCTAVHGVPVMFLAMLDHPRFRSFDVSSLRTGLMAGGPCPLELVRRVQSGLHMPEVTIGYGMTEATGLSVQTEPEAALESGIASVGRVHPHVEVRIADPRTGATAAVGEVGEFRARGYLVMRGYWNDEPGTRAVIDEEGWLRSGDLARMDADGCIHIAGRLKDVIIRGGENVYPIEVEEFLASHDLVEKALVVGVPDERYSEEVMAWVKPRGESRPTEAQLAAWCRGRIATYKVPRYWKVVEEFPAGGDKARLRELAVEELGLQEAAKVKTA